MAKVYRPPADLGEPPDFSAFKTEEGRYDFKAHAEAERAWVATVQEAARKANPRSDLAGKRVNFPFADGYAQYVVWNNTTLIWLPIGDAWSIPEAHSRGLRVKDLRELTRGQEALDSLFGG